MSGSALLADTVIYLQDHDPLPACEHFTDSVLPPTVCALHPDRGLLCPDCYVTHSGTHDQNRRCDNCGRRPGTQYPSGKSSMRKNVRLTSGQVVEFEGPLQVSGVTWCDPCTTKNIADPSSAA